MARTHYPPETRERALELYADGVGPAEVGRRLGLPRKTVASWCARAGTQRDAAPERRAAVDAARLSYADRKQRLRDEAVALAEEQAGLWRAAEKPTDRKTHAVAFGIAVDKSLLLGGDATERVEFSTVEDRVEWIKRKQDELAARRVAKQGQ